MIRPIAAAALVAFLAVAARARADEPPRAMTVADLQEICTATDEVSKATCRYFIFGVGKGLRLAAAKLGDNTYFRIPDNLSAAAMELAVKISIGQDLMVFPADRDLEASGAVVGALMSAFPCKSATRQ
jgi:hypothetical protein